MKLRSNSELFDLLVKNVNGLAIFTLDAEGRVASWNESAEKLPDIAIRTLSDRSPCIFYG